MPPWHVDKAVGIQEFKNDRSLSDAEIQIVNWVDAGAPNGNDADMPPPAVFADDDVWNYADFFGGQPDLVVYSTPYTMPALAQDHCWRPEVATGLTEDRWIRGIEIRPSTVPGRRMTHHALARLQQEEDDPDALGGAQDIGPGLLMEWAVGKQGEIMRPNSGKLIKAGSSIVWDIHYHAVGEEITDTVELGLYLYPKGEKPKHRQVLASFSTFTGGREALSILPNQLSWTITANDQTATIPMHLDPNWYVEPFEDAANKNRPPTLRFAPGGEAFEGPPTGVIAHTLNTTVGAATDLTLWATDVKAQSLALSPPGQTDTDSRRQRSERRRRPGLVVRWYKMRGPGTVTFDPAVDETSTQNPTAKATFSLPGEYVLRVEALDETGTGGGGSQCCWTSAYAKVNVGDTPHTGG